MNVDEAVDQLIRYQDNVHPSDGGYGNRITRTLLRLQQAYDEIEIFREWSWRIKTDTGTVTAPATSVTVPTDYASLGRSGKFFLRAAAPDIWTPLSQAAPEEVADYIDQQSSGEALPEIFAIYTGAVNFPYAGSNLLYKLRYLKAPKTLVYGLPADTFEIPAAYHNTVILAGAIARMQQGKGDAREDWKGQFRQGLSEMVSRERDPESEARQLPESVPPMC